MLLIDGGSFLCLLFHLQVRFFGGSKDTGPNDMKRLEACIKAGSIDEVYMLTRWNGHNTTKTVSTWCRAYKIPIHWLDSTQRAKRKAMAADASGSDGE